MKLSEKNITGLKQIEYDFETRVKTALDGVRENPYIVGFYVNGLFFKEKYFRFNPELNVLIGGRGTGKSFIVDIIRFGLMSITEDKECLDIFNNKILMQLGNEGKVVIFIKDNDDIIAISNTLLIQEDTKEIQWENDVIREFYKLSPQGTFYEIEQEEIIKNIQIEALSQTEIPRLHKKTSSLLNIVDKFIEDFSEKKERNNIIAEISKMQKILAEKYNEFDNLQEVKNNIYDINERIKKKETHTKILKKLNLDKYESLISFNSELNSRKIKINDWIERLISNLNLSFKADAFSSINSDFKKEINKLINKFNNFYENIIQLQNKIKEILSIKKNRIKKDYEDLLNEWNLFYGKKNKEYEDILEMYDIKYLLKLQEDVLNLKDIKKELKEDLKSFAKIKRNIRILETKLYELAKKVFDTTLEIRIKRRKAVKNIERRINEWEIKAKIRMKARPKNLKQSLYYNWLKKFHSGGKKEVLKIIHNKFLPFELINDIINKHAKQISQIIPSKYHVLINKLKELIKNDDTPKRFDNSLIELFKTYIDSKPVISYRRSGLSRHYHISKVSIGERCAILLYIMLLEERIPFLIDQADSELDQESIRKFSKYLLDVKQKRQIIVATHNPNIPTLGDVDLLYHLETRPKEDREVGEIEKYGGFESCIDSILKLEGGRSAIKRRFNKYDEKFF